MKRTSYGRMKKRFEKRLATQQIIHKSQLTSMMTICKFQLDVMQQTTDMKFLMRAFSILKQDPEETRLP